jgi:hypothetical protein
MFKRLNSIPALFSLALAAQLCGCAGAPSPRPDAAAPTALSAKPGTTTQFDEQIVADSLQEDFWGTGATASIDDSGRLVYVVPTEIVADGNINDRERVSYEGGNARYYYLDPVTGLPILAPANAWPGPNRSRPRGSAIGGSSAGPGATRITSPASAMPRTTPRVAPAPSRSGPARSDRR